MGSSTDLVGASGSEELGVAPMTRPYCLLVVALSQLAALGPAPRLLLTLGERKTRFQAPHSTVSVDGARYTFIATFLQALIYHPDMAPSPTQWLNEIPMVFTLDSSHTYFKLILTN